MNKTVFNIFSFILYVVGFLFLIGVLFIIISNLIYFYFITTEANITLDINTIMVMIIIALSLYVSFSIPASYAYNNEILDSKDDLTIIVFSPIIAFKYMVKFLKSFKSKE